LKAISLDCFEDLKNASTTKVTTIEKLNMKFFILLLVVSGQSFGQGQSIKEQARNIISGLKSRNEFPIGANDTLIDLREFLSLNGYI